MTPWVRRLVLAILPLVFAYGLGMAGANGDGAPPDSTDDHLEPELRSILPPFIIKDLKSVRHPRAAAIAADLAERVGIHLRPSDASISTDSLLNLITATPGETADLEAYLRLRLFDLTVGDWSRTPGDIRWERTPEAGRWVPTGAPYRNAMPQFRGFIPRAVLLASRSMTDFSDEFPPADRASIGLRYLDRRLLAGLPAAHWDSVTLHLQRQLSRAVVSLNVGLEPRDVELRTALERRSETVAGASEDLRRTVTRWAALHGTDGPDSVHVRVLHGHVMTVSISPRGSSSSRDELAFNSAGTQELRFVLGRGSDVVALEGSDPRIPIEVISEGSVTVLSRPAGSAWRVSTPHGILQHTVDARPPIDRKDWGRTTSYEPWLDLDSDDGLFVGGGPVTTTYGFGMSPFAQQTTAMAGIATGTLGVRAMLGYETHEWWRAVGVHAGIRFAEADMTKFFGVGNETPGPPNSDAVRNFEGRRRDFEINGGITLPLDRDWSVDLSLRLTSSAVRAERGTVVDSLLSSGQVRSLNFGTARLSAVYDTRGEALLPADAAFLSVSFETTPAFLQNRSPYIRGAVDAQWHQALPETAAVIVARFAGVTMSGSPPWFESAWIGGSHSLRGYERQRFRGNASLIAGLEARIPAWTIPFIWPHETGFILFAESGRVFTRGEVSRRWHSSVGFGGWARAVGSPYLASGTIARSPEDWKVSATLGFAF